MYIKLLLCSLHFEFALQDRTVSCYLFYSKKTLINYERHFPKYFRCALCRKRVEFEGSRLRLCDRHTEDLMERLRKDL